MKPIRIGIALGLLLMAMVVSGVQEKKQQDAERQLKAAINTELVDHKPEAAMGVEEMLCFVPAVFSEGKEG